MAVAVLFASACTSSSQTAITSPSALAVVRTPFTVTWSGTHQGLWAVFVDRVPVAPGHSLRDLADRDCKSHAGCPDAAYLAGRGVYVTSDHSLLVPVLPSAGGTAGRAAHPAHTVTVVPLDPAQRRQGETAATVEFRA